MSTAGGSGIRLGELAPGGDKPAVIEPGRGQISYSELDALADQIAERLRESGFKPGGRVGLNTRRSGDTVAMMLGVLRAGGAYVPVDPKAPMARNTGIHMNCGVSAVFVEERFDSAYRDQLQASGGDLDILSIGEVGGGKGIRAWLASDASKNLALRPSDPPGPEDLAYMLYTSGSTGTPKGVTISRENAEVFVDWCHRVLQPTTDDVFSNHAQFSFDVSVLDIYTSLTCGASLVIVPDEMSPHASACADLIAREKITVWYSAPAILALMAQLPDLEDRDLGSLRTIAFAGEVFPATHLKTLRERLPGRRYLNLYGPTETNVCTYYEIPSDKLVDTPQPIGPACDHYEGRVVDTSGAEVGKGEEGELVMRGPGVMVGYWNRPDLTAEKTMASSDDGPDWYRTGDLVVEESEGYRYVGRVDRMLKLRGYRVEPGEIEAALHEMEGVKEAAVIAQTGEQGMYLVAHLGNGTGERISLIKLKQFCAGRLPVYMVPEKFMFHAELPRTSTGKVDLQKLSGQE